MAAHADDLRMFYAETIGETVEVSAGAGAATPLAEALREGRYILRVLDFGGGTSVWVKQGKFGEVEAEAAAPSTQFLASTLAGDLNKPLLTFMVRASGKEGLSFFSVGGTARVQITRVSRRN